MPHLCDPLAAAAARPDAATTPLTACGGRTRSVAAVAARVAALAAAFAAAPGWRPGARVAVVWGAPSSPTSSSSSFAGDAGLEAVLAAAAAGGVVAPLNGRLPPAALAGCLGTVAATVVAAAGGGGVALAGRALEGLPPPPPPGDGGGEGGAGWLGLPRGPPSGRPTLLLALDSGAEAAPSLPPGWGCAEAVIARHPHHDDDPSSTTPPLPLRSNPPALAALVFTSGSSGPPRAAALSHAALAWAGASKARACGYGQGGPYLHAAPLAHVGGLAAAAAVLACGGVHAFLPPASGGAWPRGEAALVAALAGVAATAAVPAAVVDLTRAAEKRGRAPFLALRTLLVGGGSLSARAAAAAAAALPRATLHTAYGLTEAGSSVTYGRLGGGGGGGDESRGGGGSGGVWVGTPPPGAAVCVALPSDSATPSSSTSTASSSCLSGDAATPFPPLPPGWRGAPAGATGTILAAGPGLAAGYFRDAPATAAAFLRSGGGGPASTPWLVTGDAGRVAGGGLWLWGRGEDAWRVGGRRSTRRLWTRPWGGCRGWMPALAWPCRTSGWAPWWARWWWCRRAWGGAGRGRRQARPRPPPPPRSRPCPSRPPAGRRACPALPCRGWWWGSGAAYRS